MSIAESHLHLCHAFCPFRLHAEDCPKFGLVRHVPILVLDDRAKPWANIGNQLAIAVSQALDDDEAILDTHLVVDELQNGPFQGPMNRVIHT